MANDPKCSVCETTDDLIGLRVQNQTRLICAPCYTELARLWKFLRVMDCFYMSEAGTFGKHVPQPWPIDAKNKHKLRHVVLQADEQSSLGLFQCDKCGERWVIDSKHQANYLTNRQECLGQPKTEAAVKQLGEQVVVLPPEQVED